MRAQPVEHIVAYTSKLLANDPGAKGNGMEKESNCCEDRYGLSSLGICIVFCIQEITQEHQLERWIADTGERMSKIR
ncbi:hypothetical protein Y032_0018g3654 [Ancylostoma ceylanicum]|uniref:Uncharacterized protein n=1 Tax=Ancylostoma ceylanicum TaxID=53326 RepID=A0A016V433_9BILA|nr:hypothetical protein Y032_0018g3654 [Ancylostoma ceylanicum]